MSRRRDRYPLSLTVHGEHEQPPSCCPRAVTNGQPRSPTARQGTDATRRSADITWHGRDSELTINRRCLRQASAPGWPKADPEDGGSPAARVSRHVGSRGVADQGQGSMSFSRRVLHMDPCPWPAPRQCRRRDGIPTYAVSCPATGRHTSHVRRSCLVPLACPFSRGLTGYHGH
jgi:hypothetical protein